MTKKNKLMVVSIAIAAGCVASVLVLGACNRTDKYEANDGVPEISLDPGDVINSDILSVEELTYSNDRLWIMGEDDNSNIINVMNGSGNKVASGIRIGQGNNEILEASSLHRNGGKTYVFDGRAGKLLLIYVNDKMVEAQDIPNGLSATMNDDVVSCGDDIFLRTPVNSNLSYILTDAIGDTITTLSYFPPKPDGVEENTHHLACTGRIDFSPSDSTFVRALAFDGGVDFFKLENKEIKHIHRHSEFDMNYGELDMQVKVPVPNEKSKVGYSRICSTPEYFFVSFSDQTYDNNPEAYTDEIHVFDHSGTLLYKLKTTNPIGAFTVTEDNKTLYCKVAADNDFISRISLPEL